MLSSGFITIVLNFIRFFFGLFSLFGDGTGVVFLFLNGFFKVIPQKIKNTLRPKTIIKQNKNKTATEDSSMIKVKVFIT